MAALTKEQWLEKLRGYVPKWVFEDEKFQLAMWKGMARVLNESQVMVDGHLSETFVDTAVGVYLAQHGSERGITQRLGESISAFRTRVKQIRSGANCADLKTLIDSFLIVGVAQIIENSDQTNFLNRDGFLNRNVINFPVTYDAFTVIVDQQVPSRDNFLNRERFLSREDFVGSNTSLLPLFESLVNAINKNKAYGVVYRLIERLGA